MASRSWAWRAASPARGDLEAFWELLESGADAVTDGRGDAGSWSGAVGDPDAEDVACRRGAFVDGIDRFDSRFFRISPIEARTMDPQQRMLLETTWQAIEDAGIDPDRLRGSRTGVYAGIGGGEYRDLFQATHSDHNYLGTTGSVTVGRVAFALGLEGPAMPVDMACASSLASLHQAVAALQRSEVDLALAGGVNAILSPGVSRYMMDVGMLSPTGHCSPFDASADGYVRSEGCGMVVLKRLSEAEADGDRIYAVIRGSAVNQNGGQRWADGPEWPGPGAGDEGSPRTGGRLGVPGRLPGGPRYRLPARRPDRVERGGGCLRRGARRGPSPARRIGQVQHRACRIGRRGCGPHQDRPCNESRDDPQAPSLRNTESQLRMGPDAREGSV